MDAGAGAAALEDSRFDARQASRHEDLADDVRGRAERVERERIAQMLGAPPPDTGYDPDTDEVGRAEPAAEAAAVAEREAAVRDGQRIGARAEGSRRRASWTRWSGPSPAPETKPPETNSRGEPTGHVEPVGLYCPYFHPRDDGWLVTPAVDRWCDVRPTALTGACL